MESSQTNPVPDIPLGFSSTTAPEKPTPDQPTEEENEPTDLDLAEAYCMSTKAEWEGKETKARLLHLALEIPQPFDGDTLNTTHPFWTHKEFTDLKTHYLTFLLSL